MDRKWVMNMLDVVLAEIINGEYKVSEISKNGVVAAKPFDFINAPGNFTIKFVFDGRGNIIYNTLMNIPAEPNESFETHRLSVLQNSQVFLLEFMPFDHSFRIWEYHIDEAGEKILKDYCNIKRGGLGEGYYELVREASYALELRRIKPLIETALNGIIDGTFPSKDVNTVWCEIACGDAVVEINIGLKGSGFAQGTVKGFFKIPNLAEIGLGGLVDQARIAQENRKIV